MAMSISASPTAGEFVTFSATAPAMKNVTNGVTIPSFRPLSTFRILRTSRDALVAHDPGAERGVGRRDGSADQRREPEIAVGDEQRGGKAGRHGQWQTDAQQTSRHPGVRAQGTQVDTGRVSEEDQRQRELGHVTDRVSCTPMSMSETGSLLTTRPSTTNAIGAVTLMRSNLADTSPHKTKQAATTVMVAVSSPCSIESPFNPDVSTMPSREKDESRPVC